MKRLPIFLIGLIWLGIYACNSSHNNGTPLDSIPEEEPEDLSFVDSLTFWTSDTIKETNLELVLLMDTLYQQVRSDEFINMPLEGKLNWISEYRNQLGDYYDREKIGPDSVPLNDKAESVILTAERLWELDTDNSTMGRVVWKSTKDTRDLFLYYNEINKIQDLCKKEEQKLLFRNEVRAWDKMESLFHDIYDNCIRMGYNGASSASDAYSAGNSGLLNAHLNLYKKEREWLSPGNSGWEVEGVYEKPAKDLLVSCCKIALEQCYDEHPIYEQYAPETKKMINELPKYIDEWLDARNKWIDSLQLNWMVADMFRLNTGEVLVKLSSLISGAI